MKRTPEQVTQMAIAGQIPADWEHSHSGEALPAGTIVGGAEADDFCGTDDEPWGVYVGDDDIVAVIPPEVSEGWQRSA